MMWTFRGGDLTAEERFDTELCDERLFRKTTSIPITNNCRCEEIACS
jgi:hypothetical protein